jgi:peptidyl-prolyl cis-trans isomerase SurA
MKTLMPIRSITLPIRLPAAVAFIIALAAFASQSSFGQSAPSAASSQPTPVVLDRAVAVVNKHVILASDLQDEIRLSILEPNGPESNHAGSLITPAAALDQLISRTLIDQQIREEDEASLVPTQDEVNARLEDLRKQLPVCIRQDCASDAGWKAFLAAHELTPERVEAYLRYRLEILRFIEQRFRQGIQISQDQIQAYYRDILLPEYHPGETPPPLDQVATRIQEIMLQQQVNQLFDNWLTNLRQQGDVEVLDPTLEAANAASGQGTSNP